MIIIAALDLRLKRGEELVLGHVTYHTHILVTRFQSWNVNIHLKCTSTYPTTPKGTNIATPPHMTETLGCGVGLSDHSMGTGVTIASVAMGAKVIEKHFTLNRSDGGIDSAFSMEPREMESLVVESERACQSLGAISCGPGEKEIQSR